MSAKKAIAPDQVRTPAHLSAYVDVLGLDGAVDFLLTYGGGYSYFSADPDPQSELAAKYGADKIAALARRVGVGSSRVPTGKPFIARVMRAKGKGVSQIARRLHVSDVSVRSWLQGEDNRQLPLFDLPPPPRLTTNRCD